MTAKHLPCYCWPVRYFPINIDLQGRDCVVIGGGNVARRKIDSLLKAGARLKVVAPKIDEAIKERAAADKITCLERKYKRGDLEGAVLAFVAANPEVGEEVALEASRLNIPINVADIPEQCSFTLPSVSERGDLMLTVSTGGKCPAFSRAVRLKVEELIDAPHGEALELLGSVRNRLIDAGIDTNKCRDSLNKLIDSDILSLLRNGEKKKAEAAADKAVKEATAKD
ncbi:MAG: bifunctional precorrin-2 dehydrogenase/sirohydrochlorin ferrochelatase [Proteobacteria bacterium]|nr:bifunctional precorrin-2 dehydrogenase/sirohydrochlorin ferrochelatase [Pseudomonadota bacterium]